MATSFVLPVLVTGIQATACSGVSFALDPGNKCRDDKRAWCVDPIVEIYRDVIETR
jgi:hypothetical protein